MNLKGHYEDFYVYALLDPRKEGEWSFEGYKLRYQPFYIGCGKGPRAMTHFHPCSLKSARNKGKDAVIQEIINETARNPIIFKFKVNVDRPTGYDLEVKITKYFGRVDLGTGILTNLKDGTGNPGPYAIQIFRKKKKLITQTLPIKVKSQKKKKPEKKPTKKLKDRLIAIEKTPVTLSSTKGTKTKRYESIRQASSLLKLSTATIFNSIVKGKIIKKTLRFQFTPDENTNPKIYAVQ